MKSDRDSKLALPDDLCVNLVEAKASEERHLGSERLVKV